MAIIPLVLAVLAAASHVSAACNADNCYRALSGSAHAAAATAFCGSYMAPSFIGSIPAYASPCSSSAVRLSSACNCLTATGSVSTTKSSTSSTVSSTTLTTSTTAASICTQTIFTTISVCSSTSTNVESDTTTSTSTTTTTYTPIPTNVVFDSGFETGYSEWQYNNGNPQPDGPGTPAHSGYYSGQMSAVGPTLPDGSDAQDATILEIYSRGQIRPPSSDGTDYILTAYLYILSATSTDDSSPLCELTFLVGGQDVYSIQIDPDSVGNQYIPVYEDISLDNPNQDLTVSLDLSCQLSSGDGQYSATVLVDDLYLFGATVYCGAQVR